MSINLEYYKVFKEVAEKLSFSAAANALFITQPAVSQTITALERSLGVKLFFRTSKGVTLTAEGQHMHSYISSALSLISTGENKLGEMLRLDYGEVTIAAADTISKHFLLPHLQSFNGRFPNIKIKVINRTTEESVELVKSGSADIAFVNLPLRNTSTLKVHKILTVHDVFVASKKYSQLKDIAVTAKDLTEYPLILLEGISNTRRYIDDYFIKNSAKAEPEIELGSHDLLLEFSKIGLGISCVVKEFSTEYLKSGELFEINLTPKIKARSIGMVQSQKIPLSNTATEFIGFINTTSY